MNPSIVVSLIGRPNVGKSSIFNALMKRAHKIITFDLPGVTRDRHYGIMELDELPEGEPDEAILVDTGGFYPEKIDEQKSSDHFFNIMADHARLAINESDLIFLVLDGTEGVLPFDEQIINYVRQCNRDFFVLINKTDNRKSEHFQGEFLSLGVDESSIFFISAAHNLGINELRSVLQKRIRSFKREREIPKGIIPQLKVAGHVAILGAPNVGKSTLLNQFLEAERALVSDIPGTTVDPIDGYFDLYLGKEAALLQDGEAEGNYWRSIHIVDTAGIRRQKSIKGFIESQSVFHALRSISEAEIVIYLVDCSVGITHQDKRLLDIAWEKGKSLIIGLNKFDLVQKRFKNKREKEEWLTEVRNFLPWGYCDLIPFSAKFRKNINELKNALKRTIFARQQEIPTGALNRCFQELIDRSPILIKGKKSSYLKVRYVSMVKRSPPTFLIFSNRAHEIPDPYRRYLQKGLRETFAFVNTPIHLIFRTGKEETTSL